jgi:hypothetical protein
MKNEVVNNNEMKQQPVGNVGKEVELRFLNKKEDIKSLEDKKQFFAGLKSLQEKFIEMATKFAEEQGIDLDTEVYFKLNSSKIN